MELVFAIILTALLLVVVVFDVSKFIIPNWVNLVIIVLFPLFLILVPNKIDVLSSILVMIAFFAGGYLLFQFRVMGGGDIKLLIALSLWIGWQPEVLMMFGFWTAISGGVLSLFLIIIRQYLIFIGSKFKKAPDYPKLLRWGEPVPYGLAIAYAFGFLLWTGKIFHISLSN
jgi:prepilin peptidase CpaA